MTAIVGVLNRNGVVFAADSAATHTSKNGSKISNNANKIFTLSKYYPVGVAMYNNMAFMGIPWEAIIKMFRENLKDISFDTLEGYIDSFFEFLKKENIPPKDIEDWFVEYLVASYFNEIHNEAIRYIGGEVKNDSIDEYFQYFTGKLNDYKINFRNQKKNENFIDYKIEKFYGHKNKLEEVLSIVTKDLNYCPIDFNAAFFDSLFEFLCTTSDTYMGYTGLVFFGYGEKELFPSYKEYRISYALDGHYKCHLNSSGVISNFNNAIIAPFAQSDVTNTVIRAVEDGLRQRFYDNFNISLKGFIGEIVNKLSSVNAPRQFIDILNRLNIDEYTKKYSDGMNKYIRQNYIDSLIDTVSYLSKEDLADMAESLVRMTCIKRHITDSQETVGGPVDVAVITKGDGFIWMKRKHYFDPNLNTQFFERYNH